ncbi:HD-GYP domain-containing protein [Cytobacillus sp. IB215316]|uniref:HD-GYP domain-containing protein n=1 Tax=Cytobacillus sp. IB215316 TaxID=3097354 RepID=UPI002A129ECC|nr:HD-GYP domain-containing protein [Cytobacillus sp. IB215316]MDX8360850.1 HD-GYP domain-containing protein [Cytobacillus sp. IB215316]
MRLVSVDSIHQGTKLAKPIYNDFGQTLINNDIELTNRMIQRLKQLGITFVYINDNRTNDINPKQAISIDLRKEAIKEIEHTFLEVKNPKQFLKSSAFYEASQRFKKIVDQLLQELKSNKDLFTLLADIFSYEHYIFNHSLNVTMYSLAIGLELNLTNKELETIGIGALFHDIGKLMVPKNILLKPGKLTYEEFEEVKKHTEYGFDALRKIDTIPLVAAHCAYQHHERLDGSGYPRGIKGNEIHYLARLIAVADVFDAVASNRVYRKAMLPHEGLEILYSGSGTQFEKNIVEAFRKAVAIYPDGLGVVLSDGRKGIVAKQNPNSSDRPIIRILEEKGQILTYPYDINLSKELHIVIVDCEMRTFTSNKEKLIPKF